jgi:hypothetical protein
MSCDPASNCHGRGRGFEPRRPRHTFQKSCGTYGSYVTTKSGHKYGHNRLLSLHFEPVLLNQLCPRLFPRSKSSSLQPCSSLAVLTESATNPRRIFEDSALKELAESIRSQGVLFPLLVRPLTDQSFEIIAGARRYRARADGRDTNGACPYCEISPTPRHWRQS